jgi:hypothetical protein
VELAFDFFVQDLPALRRLPPTAAHLARPEDDDLARVACCLSASDEAVSRELEAVAVRDVWALAATRDIRALAAAMVTPHSKTPTTTPTIGRQIWTVIGRLAGSIYQTSLSLIGRHRSGLCGTSLWGSYRMLRPNHEALMANYGRLYVFGRRLAAVGGRPRRACLASEGPQCSLRLRGTLARKLK